MADLNTLSNKVLHQKLLQYGLTNVPVTDSNRTILIRRIAAAMEGKDPSKPSKPSTAKSRRETIHTTTATNPKTKSPSRTRKTTNEMPPSVDEKDLVTNEKIVPARRRTVNAVASVAKPSYTTNERNIPVYVEPRFNAPLFTSNYETKNPTIDEHNRRSLSLSKTGVVTTSYTQETSPVKRTYQALAEEEDMESDGYEAMDDYEVEDDADMENLSNTPKLQQQPQQAQQQQQQYSQGYQFINQNNSYTNESLSPSSKLYPDLQSAGLINYSNVNSVGASQTAERPNLIGNDIFKRPVQPSRQTFAGGPHSYGFGGSNNATLSPKSHSTTHFKAFEAAANTQRMSSPIVNRSTYSNIGESTARNRVSFNSPLASGNVFKKRSVTRAVDADSSDIGSSSDDQLETPYFSEFAKNLNELQSKPLDGSSATRPYLGRYSGGQPTGPHRRKAADQTDGSISLSEIWSMLVTRYHLKEAFMMTLVFMITVFIYVFFIQGN